MPHASVPALCSMGSAANLDVAEKDRPPTKWAARNRHPSEMWHTLTTFKLTISPPPHHGRAIRTTCPMGGCSRSHCTTQPQSSIAQQATTWSHSVRLTPQIGPELSATSSLALSQRKRARRTKQTAPHTKEMRSKSVLCSVTLLINAHWRSQHDNTLLLDWQMEGLKVHGLGNSGEFLTQSCVLPQCTLILEWIHRAFLMIRNTSNTHWLAHKTRHPGQY